jgi:hypothetical protein
MISNTRERRRLVLFVACVQGSKMIGGVGARTSDLHQQDTQGTTFRYKVC